MTILSLMRHAKSSGAAGGTSDFDRPLNARGCTAAERMGRELRQRGVAFDHVLASPAARVRETLDQLAAGYGALPPIAFHERIYAASAESLLDFVKALPGEVHAPLIVGHNPGLQELLLGLTIDDAERRRVVAKFPTAAFAVIVLPAIRWDELKRGTGRLSALILPRELD